MLPFEQLVKTPEYWMETIQNDLYSAVKKYMEDKNLTQSQLAQELQVSKGYVSQVLNGNFNYTLKKLIELSLHVGAVPDLELNSVEAYIEKESKRNRSVELNPGTLRVIMGNADQLLADVKPGDLGGYSIPGSIDTNTPQLKIA